MDFYVKIEKQQPSGVTCSLGVRGLYLSVQDACSVKASVSRGACSERIFHLWGVSRARWQSVGASRSHEAALQHRPSSLQDFSFSRMADASTTSRDGSAKITPELLQKTLQYYNLSREEFINTYNIQPLVYIPELPYCAKTTFVILYVVIFVLALAGNSLVIYIILKKRAIQTATDIFICSLAVSDLLITFFCIPFTLLQNISSEWFGGETSNLDSCFIVPRLNILLRDSIESMLELQIKAGQTAALKLYARGGECTTVRFNLIYNKGLTRPVKNKKVNEQVYPEFFCLKMSSFCLKINEPVGKVEHTLGFCSVAGQKQLQILKMSCCALILTGSLNESGQMHECVRLG